MSVFAFGIVLVLYVLAAWAGYRLVLGRTKSMGLVSIGGRLRNAGGTLVVLGRKGRAMVDNWIDGAAYASDSAAGSLWAEKWKFLAMGGVLLVPVAVVLALQDFRILDGLREDGLRDNDPVVLALLKGDQLVPPPPLPPAIFARKEVLEARPEIDTADRNWVSLDSDFRQRLLVLFREMERQGYQLVLLEGYRSPERQDMLAAKGSQVTSARAYQSYHQFGLAADVAFLRAGQLVISEKDPWAMAGYKLYGVEAEKVGLSWGGRWRMADLGHVELRRVGALLK
jgi:peptidoglycan L-alanyl-D-glutamate endopeptidase CwlK